MIDHDGNNLAFILSMPRSGSTLLSAILGGHEAIHAPNEPWILLSLSNLYDSNQTKSWGSRHDNTMAVRAMRDFLTQDQFSTASREFAVAAYNLSLTAAGKFLFLDKTPRYFHILPWLDELFPKAKKIWLKRNPLDVAASYFSTWRIDPWQLTGVPMTPSSFDLTIGLQRLVDYADARGDVFEVQYEKIATDSTRTIEEICAYLSVSFDPAMIDYSKTGNMEALHQGVMGDKKIYQQIKLHANSLGKWSSALKPEEIQRLIHFIGHEIFERMGYPETIQQLKTMGIRFPSANELTDRQREITEKMFPSPVNDLDEPIRLARRYHRETRGKKSPPWFMTRDGWLTRKVKNQLLSSKSNLADLLNRLGER